MGFNLSSAKVQTQKYTREGSGFSKGQDFQLKFRRAESNAGRQAAEAAGEDFVPKISSKFVLSNQLFEELGFATEKSAVPIPSYDEDGVVEGVALAVLPENDPSANTFQRRKGFDGKQPIFNNEFLEKDLIECGILDGEKLGNQYLNLTYICDVASVVESDPDYMKEVKQGKGIPLYEITEDAERNTKEEQEPEMAEA